jgi:hypothetical protein
MSIGRVPLKGAWVWDDHNPPWPEAGQISRLLQSGGITLTELELRVLGGRTLGIRGQNHKGGKQENYVLCRRRGFGGTCSLEEELQAVQALRQADPSLVPEPLALLELDGSGGLTFILYQYVEGVRLGDVISPGQVSKTVWKEISVSLAAWHNAAYLATLPPLTRVYNSERLSQSIPSLLAQFALTPAKKRRLSGFLLQGLEGLSPPSLLHGDPHIYNMLLTASGICLLDFELLAIGPPEFDFAKADLLLRLQSAQWAQERCNSLEHKACLFIVAAAYLPNLLVEASNKQGKALSEWLEKMIEEL